MNGLFGKWGEGRRRHRHRQCHAHGRRGRYLGDCAEGTEWTILANPDRKTVEMGLCRGSKIRVLKNSTRDANMVVGVRDSRYVIARSAAAEVRVCAGQ